MNKINQAITGICSFGKYPICTDLEKLKANFAILGVPYDSSVGYMPGSRLGPRRVREASTQYGRGETGYYNYESGEQLLDSPGIVDCGDVDIQAGRHTYSQNSIEAAVRQVISKGAVPVVIGGDHSITIAVGKGLAELGRKVSVVQFDCHLDFTDHIGDFYDSHSSPMRRMSEMEHIADITQIGIRGMGSSGKSDFEAAAAYGRIITAREVHLLTAEGVAEKIPPADDYYITIDIDCFDMSVAPGTGAPYPGGLTFDEVTDIISCICKKGNVVGFDCVEIAPNLDALGITPRLGALVILHTIAQILKNRRLKSDSVS